MGLVPIVQQVSKTGIIMTQLMNELHQDHQQISVLLTILKNKLATLESGARPNFALMGEVVDYLSDYAGSCHHEREDVLYHYLLKHYPAHAQMVQQQLDEHRELARLTQEMGRATSAAIMDAPIALGEFARLLSRFIEKQQQHLSVEEHKLYPLAQRCLSPEDWSAITAQLPLPASTGHQRRYRELTQALIDDLT